MRLLFLDRRLLTVDNYSFDMLIFFSPGGAERLVVDAAMELKKRGHEVLIFTAHHDRQHCFEETLGGNYHELV